jgi:MipA family protein
MTNECLRIRAALSLLTLTAGLATAHAQGGPVQPRWELGAFALGVSQQAYPGADRQISRLAVLPFFLYRGDVLRVDQGTAGVRALHTDRWDLDIGFAGNFGSRASEVPARQGMPEIGTMVEFGPRVKWRITAPGETWLGGTVRMDLPLRAVFDVSNDFARKGLSFEPELMYARRTKGGMVYNTTLSAVVGDRRLNDTFYGVAPAFATADRPAFVAQSGLISLRLNASFAKPINRDWRLFGFARVETVKGAANAASPLIKQTNGATAGIGLAYTWMRSSESGVD